MNKLIFLLLLPTIGFAQYNISDHDDIWGGYMVTDSIVFELRSIINEGNPDCQHDWCEKERPSPIWIPAIAYTPGTAMYWHGRNVDKICRKCNRWEYWTDNYYQHFHSTRNAEFDSLKAIIEKGNDK